MIGEEGNCHFLLRECILHTTSIESWCLGNVTLESFVVLLLVKISTLTQILQLHLSFSCRESFFHSY